MLYRVAKVVFAFYFNVLNRLVIKGRENIVQDGALIVYANHYANSDVFILPLIYKRQIFFMAKKELFKFPIIRNLAKAYGAFPVDRDNTDISAIKNALRTIKDGRILGIFPEGTRVRKMQKPAPKGGFVMIAYKANVPIQPIRIKYKRRIPLFNRIEVIIDKPINSADLGVSSKTPEEYAKISKQLMEKIYTLG